MALLNPVKKIIRKVDLDYRNTLGWSTDRKFILIESDDWGSIRTPSKDVFDKMLARGDKIDRDPFTRYDSLASEDDMIFLFELLSKYKDRKGNYPVITANCSMANPDFNKIRESNFEKYYYEEFTETQINYPRHNKVLEIWKEGIEKGVFYPQLHCREHLNLIRWMGDLKKGNRDLMIAFDNTMISGGNSFTEDNRFAYMDAFNYRGGENTQLINEIIKDACEIFEKKFGYMPKSFVATCYVWTEVLESVLKQNGIEYIQGGWTQLYPKGQKLGEFDKIHRKLGEINHLGQVYMVRNCIFEPATQKIHDKDITVEKCLAQIQSAFRRKKPAAICSHRLNYIGFINEENRDKNLLLFDRLLKTIMKKWPDVEFITSDRLGDMIKGNLKNGK